MPCGRSDSLPRKRKDMAKLTYIQDRYVFVCAYQERTIPKAARFLWDKEDKVWFTRDPDRAARLADYADSTCSHKLKKIREDYSKTLDASRAMDADVDIPCPDGINFFPFQKAGISFMLQRPASLLSDEMGVGKGVQTIGVINADPSIASVLIIAKASLKINWSRELTRWLTRDLSIGIAMPKEWPDKKDIVIVNYDLLPRYLTELREKTWDLIVVDEAHNIKNPKAQRTVSICGGMLNRRTKVGFRTTITPFAVDPIGAKRKLFLTGTPIPNRVVELWPLLHYLDPARWDNYFSFVNRYCGAVRSTYGMDVSGATNLDELQHRLRSTIMIRRLKKDVLPELPPKLRQVLELPTNGAADLVHEEERIWQSQQELLEALTVAKELAKASDNPEDWVNAVKALKDALQVAFTEMAKVRHRIGLAKVPYVVEHVREALNESPDKKLSIYAHHTDVVKELVAALGEGEEGGEEVVNYGVVKITGADSQKARQAAVDAFQTDPKIRVFVGNITAAGEGITLTASSHVVFAELDWTPAKLFQAEDRQHRQGSQGHECIYIQHLVLEGSLDARIAKIIVDKQAIADKALDKMDADSRKEYDLPVVNPNPPATDSARRSQIERDSKLLTPTQIGSIHQGLRTLSGICDGARGRDAAGFNKLDTRIGHELASMSVLTPKQAALGRRLLLKYSRQLGPDMMEIIRPLKDGE